MTPGELLAVILRDKGMTQAALAATLGRPPQMVSEIVTGKKRVTATTAVQLQRVFGLPALVWLCLQSHTDLPTPQCDHWNTILGDSGLPVSPIRCRRKLGHDGVHFCGSTSWSEHYGERRSDPEATS